MEKRNKFFQKILLKSDMINIILGILMIISLIFLYRDPYSQFAILTACASGGLMNIMNGLKFMRNPKKKTTGMSYLLLGLIIIGLGFIIIQYIKK